MISQKYYFVNIPNKYLYFNKCAFFLPPSFISSLSLLFPIFSGAALALRGELLYNKEDMI